MANTQGETICYQHDDFEIFITVDNLASPRAKLDRTYAQRELLTPQSKVLLGENPLTLEKGEPLEKPFFLKTNPIGLRLSLKIRLIRVPRRCVINTGFLKRAFRLAIDEMPYKPCSILVMMWAIANSLSSTFVREYDAALS